MMLVGADDDDGRACRRRTASVTPKQLDEPVEAGGRAGPGEDHRMRRAGRAADAAIAARASRRSRVMKPPQ